MTDNKLTPDQEEEITQPTQGDRPVGRDRPVEGDTPVESDKPDFEFSPLYENDAIYQIIKTYHSKGGTYQDMLTKIQHVLEYYMDQLDADREDNINAGLSPAGGSLRGSNLGGTRQVGDGGPIPNAGAQAPQLSPQVLERKAIIDERDRKLEQFKAHSKYTKDRDPKEKGTERS